MNGDTNETTSFQLTENANKNSNVHWTGIVLKMVSIRKWIVTTLKSAMVFRVK